MFYEDGRFIPASYPFCLYDDGTSKKHKAQSKEQIEITANRKFHTFLTDVYKDVIVGGRFQASDYSDFRDFEDIFTVTESSDMLWHTVDVNTSKPYKYYRYIGAEGSCSNIGEIEFYDSKGDKPKVKKYMASSDLDQDLDIKEIMKPFDGNVLSYFKSKDSIGGWVGVELEQLQKLSEIKYLPRNDDNCIREGEEYELFYWNGGQWISLEKRIGKYDGETFVFKNCPSNALFLLACNTKGVEERIFTFEDNKQMWW